MGRLIDADKLKHTLLEYHYTTEHNQIFRYIDEQPTAYDVDKVVNRLEIVSVTEPITHNGVKVGTVKVLPLREAIEIVKGGGVDE